ncbi:MAG: AbgT family transporter, partial [Vibrio fluvialis]
MSNQAVKSAPPANSSRMDGFLNFIERAGNKIPDPAILFFWALVI